MRMMSMTHDSKEKFWLFYYREETGELTLYAFTNDKKMAKEFTRSRSDRFYTKKFVLGRHEYNILMRQYMSCELEWFTGKMRGKDGKAVDWTMPITYEEKLAVMRGRTTVCNEILYQSTELDVSFFREEFVEALNTLGYNDIRNYYKIGDEESYRIFREKFIPNDLAFILDKYGYTFERGD